MMITHLQIDNGLKILTSLILVHPNVMECVWTFCRDFEVWEVASRKLHVSSFLLERGDCWGSCLEAPVTCYFFTGSKAVKCLFEFCQYIVIELHVPEMCCCMRSWSLEMAWTSWTLGSCGRSCHRSWLPTRQQRANAMPKCAREWTRRTRSSLATRLLLSSAPLEPCARTCCPACLICLHIAIAQSNCNLTLAIIKDQSVQFCMGWLCAAGYQPSGWEKARAPSSSFTPLLPLFSLQSAFSSTGPRGAPSPQYLFFARLDVIVACAKDFGLLCHMGWLGDFFGKIADSF